MTPARIRHALPRLVVCLGLALLVGSGAAAHAQRGGGPPGGGGGGRGPGGGGPPGGPGFPGSPGNGGPGNGDHGPPPGGGYPGSHPGGRDGLHIGPIGRWWDDKSIVRSIGLRKDQQKRMDGIFDANKQAIVQSYQTLERERDKLQAITDGPQVDRSRMFAQIDVVSQARASLEKATTQMLLQVRDQLDAEQLDRLGKLSDSIPPR